MNSLYLTAGVYPLHDQLQQGVHRSLHTLTYKDRTVFSKLSIYSIVSHTKLLSTNKFRKLCAGSICSKLIKTALSNYCPAAADVSDYFSVAADVSEYFSFAADVSDYFPL